MSALISRSPVPRRHPYWRARVAIVVLAGLFLMHGIATSTGAVCDARDVSAVASIQQDSAAARATTSPSHARTAPPTQSHAASVCGGGECGHGMAAACAALPRQGDGALLVASLLAPAFVFISAPSPANGHRAIPRGARQTRRTDLLALTCLCTT